MMCLLRSNRNGVESKLAGTEMRNENQNKLFTLDVGIKIGTNCTAIDLFTLSWNRNE